jgi:hypothetical protein
VLAGPGNDVQYESSHPGLVAVTPAGLAYPVAETGSEAVFITVQYPGTDPVSIPVEVDPTKSLIALEVGELQPGDVFTLDGLNSPVALPSIFGVFDDSPPTRVEVRSQFALELESNNPLLEVDADGNLVARSVIPASVPAQLVIRLRDQPSIEVVVLVAAADGLPVVKFDAPSASVAPAVVDLVAEVSDDVGVREVRFLVDGAVVGKRTTAPYSLSFSLSELMAGRTLTLQAVATDSSGQERFSGERSLLVRSLRSSSLPELDFVKPKDVQRVVERAPFEIQVEREVSEEFSIRSSPIHYIEFFLDGRLATTAYFGFREERDERFFEVWRATSQAGPAALTETSLSISGVMHGRDGTQKELPARLIRVIKNSAPSALISRPVEGGSVSVGQTLQVVTQVLDDTLGMGTQIQLLVNGDIAAESYFYDATLRYEDAFEPQTTSRTFSVPIVDELLGDTLELSVRVFDYHEASFTSSPVRLSVKNDQPPQVALSYPVEGANFVAGLPIELRASATDDLQIRRVDFYVDDRLVGSDPTAPYSSVFETQGDIQREQVLAMHAIAIDSGDQSARSQTVSVTLGKDEDSPVVNIAAPPITGTDAGESIAEVIEASDVLIKATGFDNVQATAIELRGVRAAMAGDAVDFPGARFILTGEPTHVLSGSDFALQQIPGALHAYSAFRIVRVATPGNYPIEVEVRDEVGNTSTASIVITALADQLPTIVDIRSDRNHYYATDSAAIDVQAKDDRNVSEVRIEYFIDGSGSPVVSQTTAGNPSFVSAAAVQAQFQLDLASLSLSNVAHSIRAHVTALDDRGESFATSLDYTFAVDADTHAPRADITSPIQNSALTLGDTITVYWQAQDETRVASVDFRVDGVSIHLASPNAQNSSGSFSYPLPASGDSLTIQVVATDAFGNVASETFAFTLVDDQPPVVELRSPAPGSRLIEGERFTLAASVSDNRAVSSARLFVELDGEVLFEQTFNSAKLAELSAENRFLTLAARVPHRPENGEPLRIGAEATDDRGLTAEALLDIVILDDEEAPQLTLLKPQADFELIPGDSFEVIGAGTDNIYIERVIPLLIDESDVETELEWDTLALEERVENITAPNPLTFGELILSQRFFLDFQGRIVLPESLINQVGAVYTFTLRGYDSGRNVVTLPGVKVTILGDEEAPVVHILEPGEQLVDRQLGSEIEVEASDNVALESVRVYLGGQAATPLVEETGIGSKFLHVNNVAFDLEAFVPIPAEGKPVTIIVEAIDSYGNQTIKRHLVKIVPDSAPTVTARWVEPPDAVIAGGLAYHSLALVDDSAEQGSPAHVVVSHTSLEGFGAEGARAALGDLNENGTPRIHIPYPEAGGLEGQVRVGASPVFEFIGDELIVYPVPQAALQGSTLFFDFGSQVYARYTAQLWSQDACTAEAVEIEVTETAVDRGFDLANLAPLELTAATIWVELLDAAGVPIDAPIRGIRIDQGDLGGVETYASSVGQRGVSAGNQPSVSLFVRDDQNPTQSEGFVSAGRLLASDRSSSTHGLAYPVPTEITADVLTVLAHAIDRLSEERAAVELSPLSERSIEPDQEPVSVAFDAPLDGVTVVPAERFEIELIVEDNSSTVESVRILEDNVETVRELGGRYDRDRYTVPYEVAEDRGVGELELAVIVSDRSGNATAESLVLRVAENEPPDARLVRFQTDFQDIDGIARLNLGDFFVRSGETFRLSANLFDDAGLEQYRVLRIANDGTEVVEDSVQLATVCPAKSVRNTAHTADLIFSGSLPTEYVLEVTDTVGNITRRSVVVNPLTNMVPAIRITAPAPGQLVGGAFKMKVGIVATDDRPLDELDLEVFANDIRLQRLSAVQGGAFEIGGEAVVNAAFDELYDEIAVSYGVARANAFGLRTSPNALETGYVFQVPNGLIRSDQDVEIVVLIRDSDGASARHMVSFVVAPDNIKPEVAIHDPSPGFGPPEGSFFTAAYRAYDNIKVSEVELYTSVGVRLADGSFPWPANVPSKRAISCR